MKQTAVDWLIEQLIKYELVDKTIHPNNVLFYKAKEMEKEQLEKAIEYGYQLRNNHKPINSGIDWVKEFNSLNKQD
jgi:hypothetical protein